MLTLINLLMILFMLAPLAIVIWMSFTPAVLFVLPWTDFSLRWYQATFAHPGFTDSFLLSLRLALVAALLATGLSFLAAYGLTRSRRFPGRGAFEAMFLSPLIVPAVVFGIAMLQFANAMGLYNTFASLVLAHVVVVTPFAIRTLQASLKDVPIELEWAAMNLGATRAATMWRVVLPIALRSIAAAFLLAFLMSFSEVTVTIFTTGPAYQTLPVRIYNYLSDQVDPTVAAVSALLIGLSGLLILLLDQLIGLANLRK